MAKDKAEQIKKLKYELGDLTYAMGRQGAICKREDAKYQKLQMQVNDKATEIEKLDV